MSFYVKEGAGKDDEGELEPEPLDMSIPTHSVSKTITYFVLLPIVFPLWLTLPDTRKRSCKYFRSIIITMCIDALSFSIPGRYGGGRRESAAGPFVAGLVSGANNLCRIFTHNCPIVANIARYQKRVRLARVLK